MKLALALGTTLLGWPVLALAQSPAPTAGIDPASPSVPGVHVVDDAEPPLPLVPRAKDLLRGHLLVGASVGPAWSLGKLGSNVAAIRGLGTGLALQADVGVGLSRSMVLGVWGNYGRYSDGDACGSCSGYAFSVGPFLRYHLSQGLRFDPWILAGGGYRKVSFEQATETQTYSGLTWLRLELGADYYVWSGLGVGPYGALGLSSYTTRPNDAGNVGVNTELSVGLRLLLDIPGR